MTTPIPSDLLHRLNSNSALAGDFDKLSATNPTDLFTAILELLQHLTFETQLQALERPNTYQLRYLKQLAHLILEFRDREIQAHHSQIEQEKIQLQRSRQPRAKSQPRTNTPPPLPPLSIMASSTFCQPPGPPPNPPLSDSSRRSRAKAEPSPSSPSSPGNSPSSVPPVAPNSAPMDNAMPVVLNSVTSLHDLAGKSGSHTIHKETGQTDATGHPASPPPQKTQARNPEPPTFAPVNRFDDKQEFPSPITPYA